MAEILTQQQIDDLLGNLHNGAMEIDEFAEKMQSEVKEYDFRSPKKFTRENLKILDNIYDSFSRFFSLQLSSILRVPCQMQIVQVEEQEYKEFNNALNESVLVGIMDLKSQEYKLDNKQILVEISRKISFSIIDLLLGGDGSGYQLEREYTDIELSIMEYVLKLVAQQMQNAWANYGDIGHELEMIETNSRLIQMIPPDETVAIVVIEIQIKELTGIMNICLPASALEVMFKFFDAKFQKTSQKEDAEQASERKKNIFSGIEKTPLTVSGILGTTKIELQDLLELRRGDILLLDSSAKKDSVAVAVDNEPWFKGSMGVSNKNYAVKITTADKKKEAGFNGK